MSSRPNVILLICDSLRADAVLDDSAATAAETSAFDSLADQGTTFENAFAVGAWTPPSHGAMFTGRYPSDTGFAGDLPTMPSSVPLIADWLRDAGYETYGIPGPSKMGSPTDLDRGFDHYYEVYEAVANRPSIRYLKQLATDSLIRADFRRLATTGNDYYTELKFEKLRKWLSERSDPEQPFFSMMNVTTVHSPYDPPRPYKTDATPELTRPRFGLTEELFDDPGEFEDPDIDQERLFAASNGGNAQSITLSYYDDEPSAVTEQELDVLKRWYAASVDYLDDRLQKFLQWIEQSEIREDTILVVTSDHGEFFGEQDSLYHGNFLYDPVLHVPLVISGPGVPAGERTDELVSLIDLFDTICDLCGIEAPETAGQSVFGAETRTAVFAEKAPSDVSDREAAPRVSEETKRDFEVGRKSIRTRNHRFELRSDGTEVLYELPGEEQVPDPDPAVVERLRTQLLETLGSDFSSMAGSSDVAYSEGVKRNLRNLGYLE